MTLSDIRELPTLQTQGVAADAAKDDGQTHNYIVDCLMRFYAGDYGKMPEEDTAANNAELEAGEGRIVAHYEKRHELTDDIYIIATFSEAMRGDIDANYIMIMHCCEY